jgi:hypothetical protein
MMKNHVAEVAANLAVVRHVIERTRRVPKLAEEGLAFVERWLAGDLGSRDELENLRERIHTADEKLWDEDRNASWAMTAVGNLCWMALKRGDWRSATRGILDACIYASPKGSCEKLEAIRKDALARSQVSSTCTPKGSPLLRLDPALEKKIGAHAFSWLKRSGARIDTEKRADERALRALLEKHRYDVHPFVLAFEARYGGIVTNDGWLFGASACLKSGAHQRPRGGRKTEHLVPVAYGPSDYIAFLDAKGRGWEQDTIEDPKAVLFTRDLDRVVAKIGCFAILSSRYGKKRLDLDSAQGAKLARRLALPKLTQPSDAHSLFWGDDKTLLVEVHESPRAIRTIVTSTTARTLARALRFTK